MTLLRTLRRQGVRVLAPLVAAAALLSACGGGTSQVQAFAPARLLVLGDEASLLVDDGNADGFKYGLNDRRGTTAGKCLLSPTVAQSVASYYNMVFAACNPTPTTGTRPDPKAFIHARLNAKVDDASTGLKVQIDGIADVGSNDMVLVMIGANDMIDLYLQKQAGTLTAAQATAEATRRTASAPGLPVKELAQPALTTRARTSAPLVISRCFLHQSTGAEPMPWRVNTPAPAVPLAKRMTSRSSRSCL